MTYRVVFTPTARVGALEAFRWITDRSPQAATRWYAGLERAIAKLATHPERHAIAEEDSEQLRNSLRQMLYGRRRGRYRLLFSIEGDTVFLHYVRHGAQGPIED